MLRGTRVGNAYVSVTADGDGINEDIVDAVDEAGPGVKKKGEEHGEGYGDNFSKGFFNRIRSKMGAGSSQWDKYWDKVDRRAGEGGEDAGKSFVNRMSDKVKDLGDKVGAELGDRMASNPEQVRRGIDRAFDDDFADRLGDRVGQRFMSSLSEEIDREGSKLGALVDRVLNNAVSGNRGRRGGISEAIGRMFGKGSRNNALNLLGSAMGNVARLTEGASRFAGSFAKSIFSAFKNASSLSDVFASLGKSASGAGGGIAGSIAAFAASAPLIVAMVAVLGATVSAFASVASAITAIAVAMAATITSALTGMAIVGGGALAALGIAAGLAAVAFTSMTDKQRAAAAETFEPIHAMAAGLGQIMITKMIPAFEKWSRNLQVALALVKPLAEVMGGAFARAGTILTQSLSGPGIRNLIDALGSTLPNIVKNMSSALGDFLNGVAGSLAAVMPSVERFSSYLANVARDFSKWANSGKGQNSIKDFVDRAVESLKSLWGAVKEVSGFISDVLFNPKSQEAGNTIFDGIKNSFERFRKAVEKHTKNGDLEQWFKDAIKFGKDLRDVVSKLKDTFKILDDSGVLAAVGKGLQGIADTIEIINPILKPLIKALGVGLPAAIGVVTSPLGIMKIGFDNLGYAISFVVDKAEAAIGALQRLKDMGPSGILSSVGGKIADVGRNLVPPNLINPRGFSGGSVLSNTVSPRVVKKASDELDDMFRRRNRGINDTIDDLVASGTATLAATSESAGGHKAEPSDSSGSKSGSKSKGEKEAKKKWKNPYIALANSYLAWAATMADEIDKSIKDARETVAASIKEGERSLATLITETGKSLVAGVMEAAKSTDSAGIAAAFTAMIESASASAAAAVSQAEGNAQNVIESAKATRDQLVASAEAAVQSAAQALKSASGPKEAKKALATLRAAEADLVTARMRGERLVQDAMAAGEQMITNAMASREQIKAATDILDWHKIVNMDRVHNLINGIMDTNSTMADYAEARKIVGEQLAAANQKLVDALALRDNYRTSVADSIRSFGSLLTAEAKTLDGVAQALTSGDITDNLRDRLEKIKKFQSNLRVLLAQGLSDAAYKQLVDAGVEGGSAYAQALVDGGQGSISEVNHLTEEIGKAADGLGDAAASHLYQAGVDAAQGLVDGLLSLSAELDSAAAALGAAIADAIKRSLGIASPSKVLRAMMGPVGDGTVLGLDDQHVKVSAAAARLSSQIAVSPEVAAYAAQQAVSRTAVTDDSVSGNDPKFLWTGDIVTPTEDPHAVATEVLDELTGRLT